MNRAKKQSQIDGKRFLRSALAIEQEVLAVQLRLSAESITHDGVMGYVNEQHFIDILHKYLPMRYAVESGIVIDSNGSTSDQIDIVIFDRQYTPTLLDQQNQRFIPVEAVYGVIEVKPTINKTYLAFAADKAKSVRRLLRTSVKIVHAGGEYQPRQLFPIIAGIVAPQVEWAEGLTSNSFWSNYKALKEERSIDCCLALSDCSVDIYDEAPAISEKECGLAFFLFRLLQKLQSFGTVPAIDWNRYASILSTSEE